jgi:GTPase SAR1 family protein
MDTAGQEDYAALRDRIISTHDTFILAFSIIDASSFQEVKNLHEKILQIKEDSQALL